MYQNTPLKTMPQALRLVHRYVQLTSKGMETLVSHATKILRKHSKPQLTFPMEPGNHSAKTKTKIHVEALETT